jgi:hypothetical protein
MKLKTSIGIFFMATLIANVKTPKNQQIIYYLKLSGAIPNTAEPIFVFEKLNINY